MTYSKITTDGFEVGDLVEVNTNCSDWRKGAPRETYILGHSHDDLYFVYMPCQYGGYPRIHNGVNYLETWNIVASSMKLKGRVPKKIVAAYTQSCKFCKNPARKIGTSLFCSNGRCKSRHKFKKSFPILYHSPPPKDVDENNFVICHECKERVNYIDNGSGPGYNVRCKNNHLRQHIYLEGQKLAYFNPASKKIIDYVLSAATFTPISPF